MKEQREYEITLKIIMKAKNHEIEVEPISRELLRVLKEIADEYTLCESDMELSVKLYNNN